MVVTFFKRMNLRWPLAAALMAVAALPAVAQAANLQLVSASLSDPSPSPGQVVTLNVRVTNSSAFVGGIGRLVAAFEATATHPSCAPFVTAVEADKWFVLYLGSTPSTPAAPVQTAPATAGYDLSLAASETRDIALPVQVPASFVFGGSYRLHLEGDDYFVGVGATNPRLCVGFTVEIPPFAVSSLQASVEGTANNGAIEVLWLDYDFFNNAGNQVRVALPPCFSILSASAQPYSGAPASIAGQTVQWRVEDAGPASPAPYRASGRLYVTVGLSGCIGSLALTPQYSPDGSAWSNGNTVAQVAGAVNANVSKMQLDAMGIPAVSANHGDTVKYVLSYQVSGMGLSCFDSFDSYAPGTYASSAMPGLTAGAWSKDGDSAGVDQWSVNGLPTGDSHLQYQCSSCSNYLDLLYSCAAAATNGEDICGSVMVEADVRIDGNAANGDVAIVLRDNGKATGSGRSAYLAVLSVDPNPSGNLMLQRVQDTLPTWPGSYTTGAAGAPVRGTWYTLKALEQPIGAFRIKFWQRGTPEPTGWMVSYTDPVPFPCGSAGDGSVWKPGVAGMADMMSFDNFRLFSASSAIGLQVWDSIPAGIDFLSASPAANGSTPAGSGVAEGMIRWDFTGSNYGALGGVVFDASGSFTWTGIVDCLETPGPVLNTASVKHSGMGAPSASNTTSLLLVCSAPTATPTRTATPTSTPFAGTATGSPTRTGTPTFTPTLSRSMTATTTATPTHTTTSCAGCTATGTPTPSPFGATATYTPLVLGSSTTSPTRTVTPGGGSPTSTQTYSTTPSNTPYAGTPTQSRTITNTLTASPGVAGSNTASPTRTATRTNTPSATTTATPTRTATSCAGCTATWTPTNTPFAGTPTYTPLVLGSNTTSPTRTATPGGGSPTSTQTCSTTPSNTPYAGTPTLSRTITPTSTASPVVAGSNTTSPTRTSTRTNTPTVTITTTPTYTVTPGSGSGTPTQTRTITPTLTVPPTVTFTPTQAAPPSCVAAPTPGCMYPMVWIPVCGCDGVTYTNSSAAACNGITTYTMGVCSGATATRTPLPSPGNGRTWPYPVPARGVVYFGVELGADASVRAEVLNARGRLVTVLSGTLSAGSGRLTLNLRGFAPGVYYYKLKISYADGRVENLPVRSFVVRR